MKMLWATIHGLFLLLVFLQPAVAGEIYTWTDADGNIHITDLPPKDSSQVETVFRYSNRPETNAPPDPQLQQNSVKTQQANQLKKQLTRLKERKTQLEAFIAENRVSVTAAEKDARRYRKRSGSYARRNEKAIERQLMVINNNLTTYESDLRYVDEDILETKRLLDNMEQEMNRRGNAPGADTPLN